MEQKQGRRILSTVIGAAMLASTLTPFAALAADNDYILNISDTKVFNHTNNTTTQTGSANLYYYGGPGSSISSDGQDVESDKPIKVKQTIMTDWKSAFWTEGKNYSTAKNTVFDVEFKVYLDDYSKASPYIGLRLYTTNNYINCDGMECRGIQLNSSSKDKLHHMRYVLSKGEDGKAVVLYSLDGADYKTRVGENVVATDAANWGYTESGDTAQLRFMPMALPSGGRDAVITDAVSELDTPVNWEFYSFTAYQTDDVPEPPKATNPPAQEGEKNYILNLSDAKYLDDSINTVSQDGSVTVSYYGYTGSDGTVSTRVYSDTPKTVSSNPIKVKQTKASEYKTSFKIPGSAFTTDKNIVLDVKYKVSLDDYTKTSPYIGLKLSHEGGYINEVNGMTWCGQQMIEADKDKMHTMRFVITPNGNETNANCARIYYSYDGAAYTIEDRSVKDLTTLTDYGPNNFRLWPVAIPKREDFTIATDDGEKALDTAVNWELHSITAYQTDEIPDPIVETDEEGGEEVLPTAYPVATAVPIPAEPEEKPFVAQSYLVDIDDNIVVNDPVNSIVDTGNVLQSTAVVMSSSTSDVFQVRQQKKSIWGGYLNFVAPAPASVQVDKPVVIEAKFNVAADDYSGATPKARLALALINFKIYANSNASTEIFTPADGDGFRTVKFIVDPVSGKVYTISDGKLISTVNADGLDTNAMFANGIKLYMNVCPADDNMSNDGDATLELATSMYWNFDYIKVYKLENTDTLRVVTNVIEEESGKAYYNVSVRNDHPSISEHAAVAVALYDSTGKLVDVDIKDFDAACLTKTTVKGTFDVSSITDYNVKAFLWDGAKTMKPIVNSFGLERSE